MKWGEGILKELEPITPSYEDNPNETLYAEVKEAIHKLKKNRSPRTNEVTAEIF